MSAWKRAKLTFVDSQIFTSSPLKALPAFELRGTTDLKPTVPQEKLDSVLKDQLGLLRMFVYLIFVLPKLEEQFGPSWRLEVRQWTMLTTTHCTRVCLSLSLEPSLSSLQLFVRSAKTSCVEASVCVDLLPLCSKGHLIWFPHITQSYSLSSGS